ncbi:peroxide stress protein YaaA [Cellulomonas sp. ATA003]|uniref:YaaA family protein n=1 Tax=Cellulomonas sp. ATA003 TaxID=3073064 RepID=UPI0028736A12|nr:peroxide stress protein YaaA [Cellulomonas sp. ATA003]WNB84507.1 peroxide stress protein YaaA [Cellulomonas sp. ATA003]
MLVLLPPSEGKTAPPDGAPLDPAALSHPALTEQRLTVLDALAKVSAHPDAARVLGTGPGLAAEVERNTRLRTEPACPAARVYTGVLYAAAGLDALPDDGARDRASRCVRVVSGLWGVVGPDDRIPAYRLSMGVDLPGVGSLARAWRPALAAELDPVATGGLVVDCRSAAYAAAWRPPVGSSWVTVRVLREVDGRRTVVSHHAKHTRGVLTRHLLARGPEPTTPDDLLAAARELVGGPLLDAELGTSTRSHVLTLTVA